MITVGSVVSLKRPSNGLKKGTLLRVVRATERSPVVLCKRDSMYYWLDKANLEEVKKRVK